VYVDVASDLSPAEQGAQRVRDCVSGMQNRADRELDRRVRPPVHTEFHRADAVSAWIGDCEPRELCALPLFRHLQPVGAQGRHDGSPQGGAPNSAWLSAVRKPTDASGSVRLHVKVEADRGADSI
jgi:hypothetical protein